MRSPFARSISIFFWAFIVIGICSAPARGTDCTNVVLLDASGIPGAAHSYTFTARCSWSGTVTDTSFGKSTTTNYLVTIDVKGKAGWDQKTGKASEALLVVNGSGKANLPLGDESGNFTGKWQAIGTCNQDPFLKDVTANASCYGMQIQTAVDPPTTKRLDLFLLPKRFLMERQISSLDAQVMASKHPASPSSSTPPPPPPKPNTPVANIRDAAGAQGTAKAAPGLAAAAARPRLAVVSHQATVEPNCQPPQPAMTVKLTIQNSGGPLSANKGTVFVKEFGGASLSSGRGVLLPALDTGQQQTLSIQVSSPQPYAALAGQHQLQVIFNPNNEGGQAAFSQPTTPYKLTGVFPPNHCQAVRQPPPLSGVRKQ